MIMAKNNRAGRKVKSWMIHQIIANGRCYECGKNKWLEFHHRNGGDKRTTISRLVSRNKGCNILLAELKKCTIVCSKCHKKIHGFKKSKEKRLASQCVV